MDALVLLILGFFLSIFLFQLCPISIGNVSSFVQWCQSVGPSIGLPICPSVDIKEKALERGTYQFDQNFMSQYMVSSVELYLIKACAFTFIKGTSSGGLMDAYVVVLVPKTILFSIFGLFLADLPCCQRMDGPANIWTDKPSYRDARMHLITQDEKKEVSK